MRNQYNSPSEVANLKDIIDSIDLKDIKKAFQSGPANTPSERKAETKHREKA